MTQPVWPISVGLRRSIWEGFVYVFFFSLFGGNLGNFNCQSATRFEPTGQQEKSTVRETMMKLASIYGALTKCAMVYLRGAAVGV